MILFLFGKAAAGKNHVAEMISAEYGLHFYDCDLDMTPEFRRRVVNNLPVTKAVLSEFIDVVEERLSYHHEEHGNIVAAQYLPRDWERIRLKDAFGDDIEYVLIEADTAVRRERVRARHESSGGRHPISPDNLAKIDSRFQKPTLPYQTITNNGNSVVLEARIREVISLYQTAFR